MQRPVVTKLWVNRRASEDRDEWAEEVRNQCEKCCDDKIETPESQAERIRDQRCRGDSLVALQGRRTQIRINKVLRARGKMMKNKANGPADRLVTEMLQWLPMEAGVRGHVLVQEAVSKEKAELWRLGEFCDWYFSRSPTPDGRKAFADSVRLHHFSPDGSAAGLTNTLQ